MSMMQHPGSVEDRGIIARLSMICKIGNGILYFSDVIFSK
jgi:hypothetical protein